MKKVIKFQLILIVAFVFSLISGEIEALAVDCPNATVIMTGTLKPTSTPNTHIRVQLKNVSGYTVGGWLNNTTRFFYLDQSIEKEGLATLLTAFTTGKNVWVQIPGTTAANNLVITAVLIK